MSLEEANLIDFENKDEILVDITVTTPIFFQKNNFIVSPTCGESWGDDNPFDNIHKQVVLSDDPFEIAFHNNNNNNNCNDNKDSNKINEQDSSPFKTADLLSISVDTNDMKTRSTCAPFIKSTKIRNNSDSDIIKSKIINKDKSTSDLKMRSTSLDNSLSANLKKTKLINNILNESSPMNNFLKNNENSLDNNEKLLEEKELVKKFSCFAQSSNASINRLGSSTDDSFEDLMSIQPNWIDSENENDSDIEQMRIPILSKIKDYNNESIDYSKYKFITDNIEKKATSSLLTVDKNVEEIMKTDDDIIIEANKTIENLSTIKSSDITTLMDNLKLAINKYNDNNKKIQASKLLENLNELLCNKNIDNNNLEPPIPQMFVRQGTFDIDKKNDEESLIEDSSCNENSINMETNDIDSPSNIVTCNNNINILSNLNDLLNIPNNTMNPTYIVVMGGGVGQPQYNQQHYNNPNEIINNSNTGRINRSQSLSLHDKPQSVIKSLQNQLNYNNQNNTPLRSTSLRRRSSISSPISSASRRFSSYSNTNENYNSNDNNSKISLIDSRKEIMFSPNNKQHEQQIQITPKSRGVIRKSMGGLKEEPHQQQLHQQQQPTTLRSLNNITKYSQIGIKKLRHRNSEINNGPLKATIPLKSIIQKEMNDPKNNVYFNQVKSLPMASSTPVVSGNYDKTNLNPMIAKKKIGTLNTITSPQHQTKMNDKHIQQTPQNNRRVSFLSATPNPKSSSKLLNNAAIGRRRTLSDYKEKNQSVTSATSVNNKNNNINKQVETPTMKSRIHQVTPIKHVKRSSIKDK